MSIISSWIFAASAITTFSQGIEAKEGDWLVRVRFTPRTLEAREQGVLWGTLVGDEKVHVVDNLRILHRGRDVEVPHSSWAGLARTDQFSLSVVPSVQGADIFINAGDAGRSYRVTVRASSEGVTFRRVELSEFRETVYEETTYVVRQPKEPTGS